MSAALRSVSALAERLQALEQSIDGSRSAIDKANAEIGAALREIRDQRLYKATHKSFGAYCLERWELSRSHAYRLIDQVVTVENLSPMGTEAPPAEGQLRELAGLEPAQQRQVWGEAVATAPEGKLTAAHVRSVRAQLVAKAAPEPRRRPARRRHRLIATAASWIVTWACVIAGIAPVLEVST